jgi:hypothetical protein
MNLIEQAFEKAIRLQNKSEKVREKNIEERKTKGWLERRRKRVVEFSKTHSGKFGITMDNGITILYENGKEVSA